MDFVNDEETSYRLKIAREIEGMANNLKQDTCVVRGLEYLPKLMFHEI